MTPAELALVERLYEEFRKMDAADTEARQCAHMIAHMVPRLVAEIKQQERLAYARRMQRDPAVTQTPRRISWLTLLTGGLLGMFATLAWAVVQ